MKGIPISCNGTITYGGTCQDHMPIYGVRPVDNDSLVIISLRSFLDERSLSKLCSFIVNATANTRIVTVEGNLLGKSYIQK